MSPPLLAAYRLLLAASIMTAIVWQFTSDLSRSDFSEANFFSYFTIESNLFAAGVLTAAAIVALRGSGDDRLAMWRGAAVLYITITGLGYVLLLSGGDDGEGPLAWVNAILHYVAPLGVIADWLLDPPRRRIAFRETLVWMVYPAVFIVYSMLRGLAVDWYPYPFVDPDENGYLGVAVMTVVIGLAMLGIGALLARGSGRVYVRA